MASRGNPRFGELLRWQRDLRNWTQQDVAEKLRGLCAEAGHHPGVTSQMVSTWERSVKMPERFYRSKLCQLYDATADQLGFAVAPEQVRAGSDWSRAHLRTPTRAGAATDRTQPTAQEPVPPDGDRPRGPEHEQWADSGQQRTRPDGPPPHEGEGTMPLDRRAFIAGTGASVMMIPLEVFGAGATPGEAAGSLAAPGWPRYQRETLDSLDVFLRHYHRMYQHVAPVMLLPPVLGHLQLSHQLLRADPPREEQRLLLRNRGVAALLAARLSFFDLHQPAAARAYYSMAADAAAGSGDDLLSAVVLGHMSYLPALSGDLEGALDLLEAARRRISGRAASRPEVESWLRAVESEFQADAGRERAALRAVESAEAAAAATARGAAVIPWWFDFYDDNRLVGIKGHAYVQLGRCDDAHAALDGAITRLPPAEVKQRTTYLADLATTLAHKLEIEGACRTAMQALDCLLQSGYGSVGPRLRAFRTLLDPYASSPAVRALDDRLATI